MARILYAAHGEGLGHAVRAHSVGAGLLARGHQVRFVSSLLGAKYLTDHFPDTTREIWGPSTYSKNGRVYPLRTVYKTASGIMRLGWQSLKSVDRIFSEFRPDLLISDAESFTPLLAMIRGIPFISLDNQHILTHCDVGSTAGYRSEFLQAYAAVRTYHVGARRYLISTFFDARIRYQPCTLVPPILRPVVYSTAKSQGDYLVAYLGALMTTDRMSAILESLDSMPVRAYGFDHVGQRGNVLYKASSSQGFLEDLAGCAGIVATAGHSLIGECLFLEKPMLHVPFAGQFEQRLNANQVRQMGVGNFVERLTVDAIRSFIEQLESYRQALGQLEKASLEPVLDAIERELG